MTKTWFITAVDRFGGTFGELSIDAYDEATTLAHEDARVAA